MISLSSFIFFYLFYIDSFRRFLRFFISLHEILLPGFLGSLSLLISCYLRYIDYLSSFDSLIPQINIYQRLLSSIIFEDYRNIIIRFLEISDFPISPIFLLYNLYLISFLFQSLRINSFIGFLDSSFIFVFFHIGFLSDFWNLYRNLFAIIEFFDSLCLDENLLSEY